MKNHAQVLLRALVLPMLVSTLNLQPSTAHAQGTAFTYQGRLTSGGSPANGSYDMAFNLFATNQSGVAVASPVTNVAVAVSNGLFTTSLNFGPGIFAGSNYWLEIAVSTNGANAFNTLAPRQALNPVPYAIFAEGANAAGLAGTVPAADIGGSYGNPVNFGNGLNSFDGTFYGLFYGSSFVGGTFVGSGSGLSDVWHTDGNLGTMPELNYLGTADNQPLIIKVNGQEALRLEPNPNTPNVVGGYSGNSVQSGAYGVAIGGGYSNSVAGIYGAIGGGSFNVIGTGDASAVIAGGSGNVIGTNAFQAVIAGGSQNFMGSNAYNAVIAGGYNNAISNSSPYAVVAGGIFNAIQDHAGGSLIGGGSGNVIQSDAKGQNDFGLVNSMIGAGQGNVIQTNSGWSFIGGGFVNTIEPYAREAVIGGGAYNIIQGSSNSWFNDNAVCQTIAGGLQNTIEADSLYSTIGGGYQNTILTNSGGSIIGGGEYNVIQANNGASTIAGGYVNTIQTNAFASIIAGGSYNTIGTNADYTGIVCGYGNNNFAAYSFIGGGFQNFVAPGGSAVIGGGFQNVIDQNSYEATIAGGYTNHIATNDYQSFIGGGYHNLIRANSGASAIAGGSSNTIGTNANEDTIAGGLFNSIGNNLDQAAIAGGDGNAILDSSRAAFIGGGAANVIGTFSGFSAIAGGSDNFIGNNTAEASIGGGLLNTNTGYGATIPGGTSNLAGGILSFAAGSRAKATNDGAFVWADLENADFGSTTTNQFNVRANGGVRFVTGGAGVTVDGQPLLSSASSVNASTLNGLSSSNFWNTSGNAGTSPGVNFIGTSDGRNLLIRGGFVGIGRTNPVTGADVFSVEAPTLTNFGGMYVDTSGASGKPFYGYSQGSIYSAYHYVDGSDANKWKLLVGSTNVLTVTTGGAVGIGTTAPDATLSVNGSADKPGGGSWTTFSDSRLKDLGPNFSRGLKALENIQPVSYHYKAANPLNLPSQPQYVGVVADQVQKAVPEAVQPGRDGYLTVNNDPIIWTMVNAIKELNRKVDQKDAENAQLKRNFEAENAQLKQELAGLKVLIRQSAETRRN